MIPIQNIYYMLSYAFQVLDEQGYKKIAAEKFHTVADLYAAILIRGISSQLKRGLEKEYILKTETISGLRGKIEMTQSIKTMAMFRNQIVCTHDEFSVNSRINQIIKTTVMLLMHADISKQRKKALRKQMLFFREVEEIDVNAIDWNVPYNRNNQSYRMMISICYLVIKGLLQTNSDGSVKVMNFLDEQRMCRLYEKFILEYYRKEHPEITANASQISWQLDNDMSDLLPVMQTDIMLSRGDNVLIIDAKYYSHMLQTQFDTYRIHSGNLYQIFTYVKNKEAELRGKPHVVSGMLLYAKTDEAAVPNHTYQMSGNKISVKPLDLNCDFEKIKEQLDGIIEEYFG